MSFALIAFLPALVGCVTPSVVAAVEAAHPADSYEATATGCDQLRRSESRRFASVHSAVLWARQKVGTAPVLPCEVTLLAVTGNARTRAYLITRSAAGGQVEQVIKP